MPATPSRRYLPSTRNPLQLLVVLLLVVALGLFGYRQYSTLRRAIDPWTLIPPDAALVLETTDSPTALRRLTRTDLWPTLLTAPGVQQTLELTAELDSIHNAPRQMLARFLTGKRLLLSFHPRADSVGHPGLLLLVPVETVRQHRYVRTLLEDIARSPRFHVRRSELDDIIITQISRPAPDSTTLPAPVLTVASYRNTLLISPSRALLLASIRRLGRGQLSVPHPHFAATDYLRLRGVWANVWVNFRELPAALGPLFGAAGQSVVEDLSSVGQDGLLGVEAGSERIRLNGFVMPETARGALARALGHQPPRPIRVWPVVSTHTAAMLHLGLPDLQPLRRAARAAPPAPPAADSLAALTESLLDSVVATLSHEVALVIPGGSPTPVAGERLAYAYSPHPLRTVRALSRLPGGRGAVQAFGGYVIRPVRVAELPRRLFGPLFSGFDSVGTTGAVVLVGHYAIFAPSADGLRTLLTELAAGKGFKQPPAIMAHGQRATTLTLYVNTAEAWGQLQRALRPDHRVEALRNESLLRRFPSAIFQLSHPDAVLRPDSSAPEAERWYTTLVVQHAATGEAGTGGAAPAGPAVATIVVPFTQPLAYPPTLVRGGAGGPDVVVQDDASVLHAVDAAGRVRWSDTLAGPLVAPPVRTPTGQGRARLLLATSARLYALEAPTGYNVENFPFYLSDSLRIQHLAAFTADAPNFALLIDDPAGNLYAFDAQGRPLSGWQPRRLGTPLATAARAVRSENRDLLVVALTNGDVYVLDHAGGVLPGFPVNAGGTLGADALAVIPRATLRASELAVITASGELTTYSLRGEKLRRRTLPPPPAGVPAYFTLVGFDNGTAGVPPTGEFIVSRQAQGRVALFDPKTGTLRLSRAFLTAAPKVVQAFRLTGGGGTVFALTEPGPARTYLFDERAQPIGPGFLDSDGAIALMFSPPTGELVAWTTTGKLLRRVAFRR